jgi:hypothetical protein
MSPLTRLFSFAVLAFILKASAGPSFSAAASPVAAAKARPASTLKANTRSSFVTASSESPLLYAGTVLPTSLNAGSAVDPGDASYASPVPEEPTALMLVAGLGVLSVMVWRRRIPALD